MSSSDPRRIQRVATLIRGELQRLLIEEVSDPSLRAVHVTDVRVTGDLQQARILFQLKENAPGKNPEKEILSGFKRATPFFRKRMAENLEMRYVPVLEFRRDLQGESVHHLLELMEKGEHRVIGADKE